MSNKNIYKESHFVDFYKEVENYAYLQGLDFSDVSRMRVMSYRHSFLACP